MSDRRYDEAETAAIFRAAAEGGEEPAQQEARREGLSLGELQAIGKEVGIPADAIARAALTLDVRAAPSPPRMLGLPIGVGRSVTLDRRLSDEEWEHLVVELREVFQAKGRLRSDGRLRQWSNGNLQVLLEPTPQGDRVRFATLNSSARRAISMGIMLLAMSGLGALAGSIAGEPIAAASSLVAIAAGGIAMIAAGALRVPSWARLRARQMEGLAARLALSAGQETSPRG